MPEIYKSVGKNAPNLPKDVSRIQQYLNRYLANNAPLLRVDGICGAKTVAAITAFQKRHLSQSTVDGVIDPNGPTLRALKAGLSHDPEPKPARSTSDVIAAPKAGGERQIAWGARVTSDFKAKAIEVSSELNVSPDFLMAAMAFESGETFSPNVKNAAGSGAVGLIQFMPSTAKAMGTDTATLSQMSATDQLEYVKMYFKAQNKKLETIEDLYMAILYPVATGKGSGHILFKENSKTYEQNKGLDKNKDGKITVGEAAAKVQAKLKKGLKPGYYG